jgi:glycosyltransferase involved in cell wall biosynthesis
MLSDYETHGGAAISASRLAHGLMSSGHRVTRLVYTPDFQKKPWATICLAPSYLYSHLLGIGKFILGARLRNLFASIVARRRLQSTLTELGADAISVHNIHHARRAGWGPMLLTVCCRNAPTVWTLHDMWSFTGRCYYSFSCREFITGCNSLCPTADEPPTLKPEFIAHEWEERRELFRQRQDLVAVCPSHWLAHNASAGLWKGRRVEVIPNGLPTDIYQPIEKDSARAALGIKTPGVVLLAVADTWTERRKGGATMKAAMQQVGHRPLTLMTMGKDFLSLEADGLKIHNLGFVEHETTKVQAYSAADLVVHAAPVDNLPNTIMEAMACGTPCIGFSVGGVPDMIRPGETGWLAKSVSSEGLAKAIDQAVTEISQGMDLRTSCRSVAETEYGLKTQADRYTELFKSLIVG